MLVLLTLLAIGVRDAYAAEQTLKDDVLVVFTANRLLAGNVEFDRGLNEGTKGSVHNPVRFLAEFLDTPNTDGEAYEALTARYLGEKYAGRAPRLIVSAGAAALAFLLRHRDEIFPDVPIVYAGVDRSFLKTLSLPVDAIGIPVDYDARGTLELALRLQPDPPRLVVVTGAGQWDHDRQAEARAAIESLHLNLPVEYLGGLPQSEVSARLAQLTRDAIVFTPGYFVDGAGHVMTPYESVTMMAGASRAPIYALYASQIGTGAVGGRMTSFVEMGRETRNLVDQFLEGAPVSSITPPSSVPTAVRLDWRQVRKWGIPADRIPPDAVIYFREPTFWETHRTEISIGAAVIILQAGLILALLVERRRRRRTATALAESEHRIRLAAQAARLSTFVWNLASNGGRAKARARPSPDQERQTSEGLEEILQTVHPEDRKQVGLAAREAAANHSEFEVEYRTLQPDGEVRWFAARGHPVESGSEALTGVMMDITARKTAELQLETERAALRHMSRVATMGQLSAAIAHQLNQPLAAILGNAETARKMLGRNDASPEDLREILDDIVSEDNRAAEIIRNLGSLFKRSEIQYSVLDLNDLVRETLDLLRAELAMRRVVPVLELTESLPPILGSRVHLQQVLLNLVLNAADAMAEIEPDRRMITVRTSADHLQALACVADCGTGISPGVLPRLFDPFWSTKEKGIGVGLAICKAIIEAHRGRLTAENNPEGGATFCFTLQLAESG